jgi:hypothetical protein
MLVRYNEGSVYYIPFSVTSTWQHGHPVEPCSLVDTHHCFGGTACLHLQGGSKKMESGKFLTSLPDETMSHPKQGLQLRARAVCFSRPLDVVACGKGCTVLPQLTHENHQGSECPFRQSNPALLNFSQYRRRLRRLALSTGLHAWTPPPHEL